jgi:hypothetical protein
VEGGLALFCPACPQIGINTPPETEWKDDDRYAGEFSCFTLLLTSDRLLYRPQIVVDGNMKLVHLRMRCPEDDVSLSDGEQFNVTRGPYSEHLANAPDTQMVSICYRKCALFIQLSIKKSRCHNHRAQNNGNIHRQHLDSTGKGACACARHGAFIPHCVVDFQKGERYVRLTTHEITVIYKFSTVKSIWTILSVRL